MVIVIATPPTTPASAPSLPNVSGRSGSVRVCMGGCLEIIYVFIGCLLMIFCCCVVMGCPVCYARILLPHLGAGGSTQRTLPPDLFSRTYSRSLGSSIYASPVGESGSCDGPCVGSARRLPVAISALRRRS